MEHGQAVRGARDEHDPATGAELHELDSSNAPEAGSLARLEAAWVMFRERRELRVELAWVAGGKLVEFVAMFGVLKLLTTRLGAATYGEYNLADISLVLLHAIALVPVHESFLRVYHGARRWPSSF